MTIWGLNTRSHNKQFLSEMYTTAVSYEHNTDRSNF